MLREALSLVLGDKRSGDLKCRLVIPTYDAIGGRLFLLKTAHLDWFRDELREISRRLTLVPGA
ncbi:MAG: hypothetical protein IAG10_02650 [Planctomycetaceae bacterium]|nr:hypothetical protein [Planctomycetaceae bacterium]